MHDICVLRKINNETFPKLPLTCRLSFVKLKVVGMLGLQSVHIYMNPIWSTKAPQLPVGITKLFSTLWIKASYISYMATGHISSATADQTHTAAKLIFRWTQNSIYNYCVNGQNEIDNNIYQEQILNRIQITKTEVDHI